MPFGATSDDDEQGREINEANYDEVERDLDNYAHSVPSLSARVNASEKRLSNISDKSQSLSKTTLVLSELISVSSRMVSTRASTRSLVSEPSLKPKKRVSFQSSVEQDREWQNFERKICAQHTHNNKKNKENRARLLGLGCIRENGKDGSLRTIKPMTKERSWSIGSELHEDGECHPCPFIHTEFGCEEGAMCNYCHYCEENVIESLPFVPARRCFSDDRDMIRSV